MFIYKKTYMYKFNNNNVIYNIDKHDLTIK